MNPPPPGYGPSEIPLLYPASDIVRSPRSFLKREPGGACRPALADSRWRGPARRRVLPSPLRLRNLWLLMYSSTRRRCPRRMREAERAMLPPVIHARIQSVNVGWTWALIVFLPGPVVRPNRVPQLFRQSEPGRAMRNQVRRKRPSAVRVVACVRHCAIAPGGPVRSITIRQAIPWLLRNSTIAGPPTSARSIASRSAVSSSAGATRLM